MPEAEYQAYWLDRPPPSLTKEALPGLKIADVLPTSPREQSQALKEMLHVKELLESDLMNIEKSIVTAEAELVEAAAQMPAVHPESLWIPGNLWNAAARHIYSVQLRDADDKSKSLPSSYTDDEQLLQDLSRQLPWMKDLQLLDNESGTFSHLRTHVFAGTSETCPVHDIMKKEYP